MPSIFSNDSLVLFVVWVKIPSNNEPVYCRDFRADKLAQLKSRDSSARVRAKAALTFRRRF